MKKNIMRRFVALIAPAWLAVFIVACGSGGGGGGSSSSSIDSGSGGDGGSQYSNATLSGSWILIDSVGGDNGYIIADGTGKITEAGLFGMDNPPGNYTVGSNGSITLNLSANNGTEVFSCTGQFDSSTHANCTIGSKPFELKKVTDLAVAQGTWTGIFTESPPSTNTYNISFNVDANGNVTSFTGFTGPVTGKMYAVASGEAVGFFWTGASDKYNQIAIRGNLVTNSFTGTFGVDNGSGDDGTVGLTR